MSQAGVLPQRMSSPLFLPPPRAFCLLISVGSVRPRGSRVGRMVSEAREIRVCVNKTCSRSGSRETLALLEGLAPPGVSVVPCSCLGLCGSGPNVAVLPDEVVVQHCATASRVADLLAGYCGITNPTAGLEALALRKRAEGEMDGGNIARAISLLNQAIDLKPSGGLLQGSEWVTILALFKIPLKLQKLLHIILWHGLPSFKRKWLLQICLNLQTFNSCFLVGGYYHWVGFELFGL